MLIPCQHTSIPFPQQSELFLSCLPLSVPYSLNISMSRQGGKPKNWYDNYTMDKTLKPALKLLGVSGHGNKPAIAKQLYSNLGNHITAPSAQLVQAKVSIPMYCITSTSMNSITHVCIVRYKCTIRCGINVPMYKIPVIIS